MHAININQLLLFIVISSIVRIYASLRCFDRILNPAAVELGSLVLK